MKLLIAGGTGFVGSALCEALQRQGHELFVVTRTLQGRAAAPGFRWLSWEPESEWQQALEGCEGLINLAGEPLVAKRWSPKQKAHIRESRVQTTRRLVQALTVRSTRPAVLINASAVGYYGSRADQPLQETDAAGTGFLADVCRVWEAEAQRAEGLGVRVIRLRIGLVLGAGGGALSKMVPPFRAFLGGPLGNGRQWVSWIHRDDVIGLIAWALKTPGISGAVNATAPEPVTMRELCRRLGGVLGRPSWAPVPAIVLRLGLGEMADMLLSGQRVVPTVALRAGYAFAYPNVTNALSACLSSPRRG